MDPDSDSGSELSREATFEILALKKVKDGTLDPLHNLATFVMDAPYTIASLPNPLDKENGGTYAAPIHAFKGRRKRKRHEVAAAVDGEGISIYNVDHPRSLPESHCKLTLRIGSKSSPHNIIRVPSSDILLRPTQLRLLSSHGRETRAKANLHRHQR